MPSSARVVVIGGGIMGCSVAYHLTKMGWTDVVLLEQHQLTAGTTWHAAGLVGQLRNSENLTRITRYAIDLYGQLEAETGQATGFKQNGALTLAQTEGRFTELRRHAVMAGTFGIECHVVGSSEVKRRWPMAEVNDLQGAIWLPYDGQTNPTDTTQALAKGARQGGAKVIEGVAVRGIETRGGAVAAVSTDQGRIACEYVVACAGLWTRELTAPLGVTMPLHASEHMYIVTEPMDGITSTLPVLRDYDARLYFKEDAGKLLVGVFEEEAKPWGMGGIPEGHEFGVFDADWDHFEPYMLAAIHRIPGLETAGIRQFLNGAESFTPDQRYMLGEAPELRNLYIGAGFNSIGIASAAGAGKALVEWLIGGEMPMDLWEVDIRRFMPFEANPSYLRDRTVEAVGEMYAMHWPYKQYRTARNARLLPTHERLRDLGAQFGVVAGWERPLWFNPDGPAPAPDYTYGPQPWWPFAAEECRAAREDVALFEMTPFAKYLIQGAEAESYLQRLCANDIAGPVGKATYTQLLNARGGIEADLTVTRLAESQFLMVTSAGSAVHDLDWLRRNLADGERVSLTDVGSAYATLGLMGPKSRDLLGQLSRSDLSNEAFPFGSMREIDLGYAMAMAVRISYVGELGWELYLPAEFTLPVYDRLVEAGAGFGLRHAGLQAQDSLRLEKAFKHWGHDIGPDDTPLQSGLGFACAFDKEIPFIGRDALLRQREEGLTRRLVTFTVDEGEPLLLHEEPVFRDGELVGGTTSGAMAHTLGRPICMAYVANAGGVSADYIRAGGYQIDVAGERFPATAHLAPPYDPKGERMRG
ncbi:MAG: FAD-dependent oxidoreductase [Alphaproteobacteria bacterium]|nr:FAD-dependent oxidoreductase [Alphaproteobacteria bacterium]